MSGPGRPERGDHTEFEPVTSEGDARPPTEGAAVASRWWYWIAALPVFSVLAVVVVIGFVFFAVAFGLLTIGAAEGGAAAGLVVGLFWLGLVVVLLFVVLPATVLHLVFPVALYLDAEAVRAADGDWRPDPTLYAALGVLSLFVQVLGVLVALYYLYRRHEHVGTP